MLIHGIGSRRGVWKPVVPLLAESREVLCADLPGFGESPVLDGEPIIVVEDGRPLQRNLARNRITIGELQAAARLEGIGSIGDVRWAVLETSGKISFIQK